MIQILDFSGDGNVDIVYNRAGADETVSLVFTDGADGLSFDKDIYGLKHEVGMTLDAWNANIDPTDEDVWTFGTLPTNQTAFYQLYDENGANDAATTATSATVNDGDNAYMYTTATIGNIFSAGTLSIDRNGDTVTSSATTDAVIDFQDNADTTCTATSGLCATADINGADQPITLTEAGANTGVFINWDEGLTTNMKINEDAKRGSQAVFEFDEVKYGVLHMPQFATIEYLTDDIGAEWNSGEVVSIEIFDPDMNFDQRSEDVMNVSSTTSIVPAIKIGSPITLKNLSTLTDGDGTTWDTALNSQCSSDYSSSAATSYQSCYEKYSERSLITTANDPGAFAAQDHLVFTYSSDTTVSTLTDLISGANGTAAYTYVQYDFRGLNGGSDNLSFKFNFTIGDSGINQGGVDNVGIYGTTSGTIGTTAGSGVGISYTEGLVGNALIKPSIVQTCRNKFTNRIRRTHGFSKL